MYVLTVCRRRRRADDREAVDVGRPAGWAGEGARASERTQGRDAIHTDNVHVGTPTSTLVVCRCSLFMIHRRACRGRPHEECLGAEPRLGNKLS